MAIIVGLNPALGAIFLIFIIPPPLSTHDNAFDDLDPIQGTRCVVVEPTLCIICKGVACMCVLVSIKQLIDINHHLHTYLLTYLLT